MPMLVLLAWMVRTNPAIRGSKRQVSIRCAPIVALLPVTLQSHRKKMYPSIGSALKPTAIMNAVQLSSLFIVWFSLNYHTQKSRLVKFDALRANILGAPQTKGVPLQPLEVRAAHTGQRRTTEYRQM